MAENKYIKVKGAREHNLKNINVDIPKDKLVVITGLSGSGKSSLAFDTIYAEGQRRYVESLSAYARQFLGQMEKPDVENIEGLSPAIAIDQKTSSRSPRSTVGTVTEIHDYLRLLWARIGTSFCPECGEKISKQSIEFIVNQIKNIADGSQVDILAPLIKSRKGEFRSLYRDLINKGFTRVETDGEIIRLEEAEKLNKYVKHDISVVVDRIKLSSATSRRLSQSVEAAAGLTDGQVDIKHDGNVHSYSQELGCIKCGISYDALEPRNFSFNSPFGACEDCNGLGVNYEIDEILLVRDQNLSINDNVFPGMSSRRYFRAQIHGVCDKYNISKDKPYKDFTRKEKDLFLYGTGKKKILIKYRNRFGRDREWEKPFKGIVPYFKKMYTETTSDLAKKYYLQFMREKPCIECEGARLNTRARNVKVGKYFMHDFNSLPIDDALKAIYKLKLKGNELKISQPIIREIKERLKFLDQVGLSYLQLNRGASTLSGGESQRIRLATQIGSGLTGVLYVLDEPSIGLHHSDNRKLIDTLEKLRDLGNTVLVVEHDEDTMTRSDHLIDIGWGAGEMGGKIVSQGTWREVANSKKSLTGSYLSKRTTVPLPSIRRNGNKKKIVLRGASENNLKNLTIDIPLNKLIAVTGVSGSGKSTLIQEVLAKAINRELNNEIVVPGKFKNINGIENIDRMVIIDQTPIGRTPRSNPATYAGAFDHIRKLYSQIEESRVRGYTPGRFSFNVPGGRCEECRGDGNIKVEMYFLPDVYVVCEDCKGSRFNSDTLAIQWKGNSIADILDMTVEDARNIFEFQPSLNRILSTLHEVGLSYIKLGQPATTLSGGEAQRIKLAKELSKRSTGKTLYILDEPTTGLHFADIEKLLEVLHLLVDKGNTVLIIEHNMEVIKNADWILDLGPGGGKYGGKLVGEGTPEALSKNRESLTGKHLKEYILDG
ncbi:MAG: excinuclease ABC subunit UvrA [Actinomycetota bacterium]|nr:excinuclease ABC subunit UvrA [Actinomycetota bacterium]